MKRLYYYAEKTKYVHLLFILISLAVLVFLYTQHDRHNDNAILGVAFLSILYNSYKLSDGLILLYKKRICTQRGQQYDGRIVGKIGKSTLREGYFYKLIVLYEKDKITTPLIQAKYVEALKSKKCIVYVYDNKAYISGYTLCEKGDSPIKVRIVGDQ